MSQTQQAVDFSLLSLLVDMGFEQQRATSALLATNNASIDAAIDYMNKNTVLVSNTNTTDLMSSSNPIEEYKKQQQAKFDAEKNKPKPTPAPAATAKPTTSAPPDTTILASDLKLRGDNEAEKQRFEEKLRQQEMEARLREKEAKRKQLLSLRTQLKAEKKDRLEKKQPASTTTTTTTTTKAAPTTTTTAAQEASLQIRLPDGSILKHTTLSNATLMNVAQFIMSQNQDVSDGAFSLVVPFPRKEYGADELETVTLMQALGAPRGQIVVQKTKSKGVIVKGDGPVAPTQPAFPVPTYPQPNVDVDIDEPMTGDNDEQQLLCSTPAWYLSTEEITTQTVLIFRPDNFAFPTDKEARPMMSFKSNMNVTARDSSNMTQTGAYKLKVDAGICQLEIHMVNESVRVFDVVSITDEILVLQVAE